MEAENTEIPRCLPHAFECERIAFSGSLGGMTKRLAAELVRQGGGVVVSSPATATLVVIGEGQGDKPVASLDEEVPVIPESDFWERTGLKSADSQRRGEYSPARVAELVGVPVSAVRHWLRKGTLVSSFAVCRLHYVEFEEITIVQKLAELLRSGLSLEQIDRKLAVLERRLPLRQRPIADCDIVVRERSILLRTAEGLAEPGGQRLLWNEEDQNGLPSTVSMEHAQATVVGVFPDDEETPGLVPGNREHLESLAVSLEQAGAFREAAEQYRSILLSGEGDIETQLGLADALYRSGELGAARERYYCILEQDEHCVEARVCLGCVLAALGESELAISALEGALEHHPRYADAHFLLASLLEESGSPGGAAEHWEQFSLLGPESTWSKTAQDRLASLDP